MKKVVTRADDFGSFRTANKAIIDCVNDGIVKNVSIMVITDYWKEAEALQGRDDICLGLHASINAEWSDINWKPISSPDLVSSLLTEDGFFHKSIQDITKASLDEILLECKAQLDLARSIGLNIEYIDTHCCFEWLQNFKLRDMLDEFAKKEGIIFNGSLGLTRLPQPNEATIDSFLDLYNTLDDGTYLLVGHPCYPVDEIHNVIYPGVQPGDIAEQRDFQRDMFLNPAIVKSYKTNNIVPIKYTELCMNNK